MLKFNKIWIIFSALLWLACCQGLFVLIQSSLAQRIVESTQNQLRQELDFSNFNFIARSITDFTASEAIRCAVLDKISPENIHILDLRYMGKNCKVSAFQLDGTPINVTLKTLNGDSYQFKFISNNPFFFDLALWGFRILGVLAIVGIMLSMQFLAERKLLVFKNEIELADKVNKIALQVSHDIRSPLTALKMAMDDYTGIPKDNRAIIQSSIERINDIANNLLNNRTSEDKNSEGELSNELLATHIDLLVSEKRMQYRQNGNIQIESNMSNSYGLFAEINVVEFKRVLSNLINNAVEAIESSKGKVKIKLSSSGDENVLIEIIDNGKGMSSETLKRLGERGFTEGKSGTNSGNGLGMAHSFEVIKSFSGILDIESNEGIGTQVRIFLPRTTAPSWFAQEISLKEESHIFILDDDESMHGMWSGHLSYSQSKFVNIEDFIAAVKAFPTKNFVAIVDYEFIGQTINGIQVIESLNIEKEAYLVTSHYENEGIIKELEARQIKMIPKVYASLVPVNYSRNDNSTYYEYVYIEDEKLLRLSWERKARKKNVSLLTLSSPADFKQYSGKISKELSQIYIDVLLGDGKINGIEFAQELHTEGYKNLFTASGLESSHFEAFSWLKHSGKEAPF